MKLFLSFCLFIFTAFNSFAQNTNTSSNKTATVSGFEQQTDINITIPMVGQFDLKHCGLQAEEQLKPITNFMVVKIDNEIYFYINEPTKIRDVKK